MGTIELKETLSKVQFEGLDSAYFEQGKITHCKFITAKKKGCAGASAAADAAAGTAAVL